MSEDRKNPRLLRFLGQVETRFYLPRQVFWLSMNIARSLYFSMLHLWYICDAFMIDTWYIQDAFIQSLNKNDSN